MAAHSSTNELHLEGINLRKAALLFRVVNHKLRQEILSLIHKNGSMTVTAIYTTLRIEQSVASQHLGLFRKTDLVNTRKEGKNVYYSVNYERLKEIENLSAKISAEE